MTMNETSILEGIIIGFSASTAYSILAWLASELKKWRTKKSQQKYISDAISNIKHMIFTEIDEIKLPTGATATKDSIKKAYFDNFLNEMDSILESRTTNMSYDEIQEVKKQLTIARHFKKIRFHDLGYREIFDTFESIPWVKPS
ncbi:MAG: hypothetical protein OXC13_08435 [Caldilineaceae bacterium]|nr:hypothetical protein [Caldilineaceae bacterium]